MKKKMSKWQMVKRVFRKMIHDLLFNLFVFIEKWLPKLIDFTIPFFGLIIGVVMYKERGYFAIGGEWLLLAVLEFISSLLKRYVKQNRIYNELNLPIPAKRFTEDVGGGEYQVDTDRLQEMILYVADVEDWLRDNDLMEDE